MTAILIDDEQNSLDALEADLLACCPEITILAKCNSSIKALEVLKTLNPTVVFLDIEMPILNGFELLKNLEVINFEVIFVTAYNQFALKAFQFSAIDYLLKPIDSNLLQASIAKLKKTHPTFDYSQLNEVVENFRFLHQNITRLAFTTSEGIEFLEANEIIFAEVENDQTIVHLISGEKIFISKPLRVLEKMLENKGFLRIHQSYLVNFQQIRRFINGQGGDLVMNNGKILPVSRNGKPRLLELLTTLI